MHNILHTLLSACWFFKWVGKGNNFFPPTQISNQNIMHAQFSMGLFCCCGNVQSNSGLPPSWRLSSVVPPPPYCTQSCSRELGTRGCRGTVKSPGLHSLKHIIINTRHLNYGQILLPKSAMQGFTYVLVQCLTPFSKCKLSCSQFGCCLLKNIL